MVSRVRFVVSFLALLAIVAGVSACSGGPKRQLRMNLPPGSAYELTVRSDVDLTLVMQDGNDAKSASQSTLRMLVRVASVYENGDVLADITIEELTPTLLWGNFASAASGAEFGARITSLGEVADLFRTGEMRDDVRTRLPSPAAAKAGQPARTGEDFLKSVLSDENLRLPIETALRVWPAVPVAKGDQWESGSTYDPSLDAFVSRTFTLTSWDEAMVIASFTADLAAAQRVPGQRFNGSGSGEVRFAPIEGILRSARFTRTYSGSFDENDPNPITIDGTGTYQIDWVAR